MITEAIKTAVIEQLGYELKALEDDSDPMHEELTGTLSDISAHGIDGGFHGFIYYTETGEFYDQNAAEIHKLADAWKFETGEAPANPYNLADPEEEDQAKNWLAWFAAESVAHELANL
jgi:hypothetical protein